MTNKKFNTKNLHLDRSTKPEHGALHKPIHTSVAFGFEDAHDLAAVFQGTKKGYAYSRQLNPTVTALQNKVTRMEEGVATLAFATGMAAIAATMLSLLRAGDNIIASSFLFANTRSFLSTLEGLGITVTLVDPTESRNVEAAITPDTTIIFVETIANPVTQVADLAGIGAVCLKHNILYCVDNTLTTPYLFLPKTVSASLVINSLTKSIGGHGNALGGTITDTGLFDWSSFKNIISPNHSLETSQWGLTQIRKKGLRDMGATLGAESAHHLSIGSETLSLRLEKACSNAMAFALFCDNHPLITQTFYPGLKNHPQHIRATELFNSFGTLVSINLDDKIDCFEVLNNMTTVITSTNLGDNRTLGIPVAHTIFYELGPKQRESMGIKDSTLRFAIGIEDEQDLLNDLNQALEKAGGISND
ncbi:MAG: cystathionine gamma-synthase family protein [Gammaproteobacteria bacterium]|nr:cystathionine gamma-synthase family protein [Gammaproteobacteria bacterium]